jgi:hypothetical protein
VQASPGLTADVLYLRPAMRSPLLQVLAELGVFIRETAPPAQGNLTAEAQQAEFLVLIGDSSAENRRLIRLAAMVRGVPVAVVLPPSGDKDAVMKAGAVASAYENEGIAGLRNAVGKAAQVARALRGGDDEAPEPATVFGRLELHHSPAELSAGDDVIPLSRVEYQILSDLAWARGALVPKTALQTHLLRAGEPTSPGYLKAVVARIRRKAASIGGNPQLLTAVRGSGYVLRG